MLSMLLACVQNIVMLYNIKILTGYFLIHKMYAYVCNNVWEMPLYMYNEKDKIEEKQLYFCDNTL